MRHDSLTHLSDDALLRELARLVAHDRVTTAALIAHMAEVDARRLYAPAGYPSMHAYCVGELHLSEDAASKRIQAARAARRFPILLDALADGRLHLTGVCLLAPHLTPGNSNDLISAAQHRRKSEIEGLLLRRPMPPVFVALAEANFDDEPGLAQHAPAHVPVDGQGPAGGVARHAPAHVGDAPSPPAESPIAHRVSLSAATREKLRYAQDLLSHALPKGDEGHVIDRALDLLIATLEKRKFGAATKPPCRARATASSSARPTLRGDAPRRHVPAAIRRAVWERDEGRCTFVAANGTRCGSRRLLEFDHVEPVARGGRTTVEGLRLRCRAHNQYEAERRFGRDFMESKRRDARNRDLEACLRRLGCRAEEARRAVDLTAAMDHEPLEERLRAALRSLGTRAVTSPAPPRGEARYPFSP
ncbi:MAG TPA: hypothetical protein VFT32_04550 [Candidatus Eisenbacteria bacterium]|nr:hypothetical protein [Candidatus Eisenbacteria bacterium]